VRGNSYRHVAAAIVTSAPATTRKPARSSPRRSKPFPSSATATTSSACHISTRSSGTKPPSSSPPPSSSRRSGLTISTISVWRSPAQTARRGDRELRQDARHLSELCLVLRSVGRHSGGARASRQRYGGRGDRQALIEEKLNRAFELEPALCEAYGGPWAGPSRRWTLIAEHSQSATVRRAE
jgi:hypothetical protein